MADIVLFHSALGVQPGVHAAAERMGAVGHAVHVPDLFEGRSFDEPGDGLAYAKSVGWDCIRARADAAVAWLPPSIVVAGISMGAPLALHVATTRPGVRGALALHAGAPPSAPWPARVPLEVHHSVGDPWVPGGATAELVRLAALAGSDAALHLYPGDGHLFADAGSPDYDEGCAELLWRRVLAFLTRIGWG